MGYVLGQVVGWCLSWVVLPFLLVGDLLSDANGRGFMDGLREFTRLWRVSGE